MRKAFLIVVTLACCGGCSSGSDPVPPPAGVEAQPESKASAQVQKSNFPEEPAGEDEWEEFFLDRFKKRELTFPDDGREASGRTVWRYRSSDSSDNLDFIRRGGAEGAADRSGFVYDSGGGYSMSYDPELRRMGLKVGRDGNLHRVGPDARDPRDPDEGPVVDWDELHRKQFGH
jgi:hypothetical protein